MDREPNDAAQTSQAVASEIRGRLVDDAGAGLPGAVIVARSLQPGVEVETVTDANGELTFAGLPAGQYDLSGDLEGFDIKVLAKVTLGEGQRRRVNLVATPEIIEVTSGLMIAIPDSLREVFEKSDLVVAARVISSTPTEVQDETVRRLTELRIETLIHGRATRRTVPYVHSEYLSSDGESDQETLQPGDRVLALLRVTDESVNGKGPRQYEAADWGHPVKKLGKETLAVYVESLEELAELMPGEGSVDVADSGRLADWLVATAEHPETRSDVISELATALQAVGELAAKEALSREEAITMLLTFEDQAREQGRPLADDLRPSVIGAHVTLDHQARLMSALLATEQLDSAGLQLFSLVRPWDDASAKAWLIERLRAWEPAAEDELFNTALYEIQLYLDDSDLAALVEEASDREDEIGELWEDDDSEATEMLRQARRLELLVDLRELMVEVLSRRG